MKFVPNSLRPPHHGRASRLLLAAAGLVPALLLAALGLRAQSSQPDQLPVAPAPTPGEKPALNLLITGATTGYATPCG